MFTPAWWSPQEQPKLKESFDLLFIPVISLRLSLSQSLHPYISTDKSTNLGLAHETPLSQALLAAIVGDPGNRWDIIPQVGLLQGPFPSLIDLNQISGCRTSL